METHRFEDVVPSACPRPARVEALVDFLTRQLSRFSARPEKRRGIKPSRAR